VNELRELAPQVLAALVRRYGDFAGAEDAVQEALIAASTDWPQRGRPDNPRAWLIRVASRRLANQYRAEDARRRREELAASWSVYRPPDPAPGADDTLLLMMRCCHPVLSPGAAVPLALRAVGGLTTKEIAAAFLVPEATMAQRIGRAKAKLRQLDEPFRLPADSERADRLESVLHVLYLMFNEGYAASAGPELGRPDLAVEAIRLTRMLYRSLGDDGDDPEVEGLLGLMLLSESRRPARSTADGALVPLAEQDRSRWDHDLINEGLAHTTAALQRQRSAGPYTLQAAVNALHAEAPSHQATRWADIATLYHRLEQLTGNPVVRLNRAVAVAMIDGPATGLELIEDLDRPLGDHYRLTAVRAHLYEMSADRAKAIQGFRDAAARATNLRERNYLLTQAARVATYGCRTDENVASAPAASPCTGTS
jgi:RNA polymerase sigma factor (sigma-70 family)